jgi:uncharacterized protein
MQVRVCPEDIMTTSASISMVDKAKAFLALRRFAVVGVSRSEKDFTRGVMRELIKRGYDVVPVHPSAAEIEGRRCFGRLSDIEPPVEGALLFTSPVMTAGVVRDAVPSGIRRVWMHRGAGPGAASPEAIAICAENDIEVIEGLCPFMVLPQTSRPHRLHGFFRRRSLARREQAPSAAAH